MSYSNLKIPRHFTAKRSRRGYVTRRAIDPSIILAAQMKRWSRLSHTMADRSSLTTIASSVGKRSFRLVDGHGRAHGRRYTLIDGMPVNFICRATDQYGNHAIFKRNTPVRIVAQQEEELHSRISRMLTAAFRSAE